jgi:glutamyl-tRNA synthetase
MDKPYRGRLAPSPTGHLHLGHARTFWQAHARARQFDGVLVFRDEDLDSSRCKPEFVTGMIEDLRWFGFTWQEGPDCGGAYAPYRQSERTPLYRTVFEQLKKSGLVYPCRCSRKDVIGALQAPHAADEEPLYPGTCRPTKQTAQPELLNASKRISWRFQVPDGEVISFIDGGMGSQKYVAGKDFGDFIVWRHDDIPSYQLAVVADDHAMNITEVVRGADLLVSTARQMLLYRALGWDPPGFYHCPLVRDENGIRLAKRHDALSLRKLRQEGKKPEEIRATWNTLI